MEEKEEIIESLDDSPVVEKENPSKPSPTDLNKQTIDNFGHENIPLNEISRKANIRDIDLMKNNDEFINIGKVPPGYTIDEKKPFKLSKPIFIIIVAIVIIGIGSGLYYYLSRTKTKAVNAVVPKTVEVEVNTRLSLKLDDYATFKDVNPTNCILNIKSVDASKVGTYPFVISCGVNKYQGKVIIKDSKGPEVVTKVVVKKANDEIDVNDFIKSCIDNTKCSFELTNFDQIKEEAKSEGFYNVNITASDEKKNVTYVNSLLIILDKDVNRVLSCENKEENVKLFDGVSYIKDDFLFSQDKELLYNGTSIRTVVYKFNKEKEYNQFKKTITEDGMITIDDKTGKASYNDQSLIINLRNYISLELLKKENNNDFPLYTRSIINLYEKKDYSCEIFN